MFSYHFLIKFQMNFKNLCSYANSQRSRRDSQIDSIKEMSHVELRHIEEEEEDQIEASSKNEIYDYLSNDEEEFFSFTGFTIDEFGELFSLVENVLERPLRGRKPKYTVKDQFIILLHYLRYYPRLEGLKTIFNLGPSKMESLLIRNLQTVGPKLISEFITNQAENCDIVADDDFPTCGYIVDATVQQINQPSLEWEESSKYFSGKHSMYCLKSQVIVTLKGLAVHVATSYKGSVHDKVIFDETIDDFKESVVSFHDGEPEQIMADKGYQDSQSQYIVSPIKGSFYTLSPQDLSYNEKLSKIRIIVENFFGRLKCRYKIIGTKYRGSHAYYELFFKTCCALVNFEIIYGHPLRDEDHDFFLKHRATIRKKIEDEKFRRKQKMKILQKKRMKRFQKTYELEIDSSDSS